MFDEAVLMLPLATRTNMFDAMKKANAKPETIQTLLDYLRGEHDVPCMLGQLETLWRKHTSVKLEDDYEPAGPEPQL